MGPCRLSHQPGMLHLHTNARYVVERKSEGNAQFGLELIAHALVHLQGLYDVLRSKRTSLKARVPAADDGCIDFLSSLLTIDPSARPTAAQALQHPWLQQPAADKG